MPKSKHRRKAGEKAVPHPGRQRAEPSGWVASRRHGPGEEEAGSLSSTSAPEGHSRSAAVRRHDRQARARVKDPADHA